MKYCSSILLIITILALPALGAADEPASQGTVNLNTASAEQLQMLPRVGPSLAARIIAFREANGAFRTTEELIAVKGIGESTFKKMSPYVAVTGETTLIAKVSVPRSPKAENSES